jgi:hypothetical protein
MGCVGPLNGSNLDFTEQTRRGSRPLASLPMYHI